MGPPSLAHPIHECIQLRTVAKSAKARGPEHALLGAGRRASRSALTAPDPCSRLLQALCRPPTWTAPWPATTASTLWAWVPTLSA